VQWLSQSALLILLALVFFAIIVFLSLLVAFFALYEDYARDDDTLRNVIALCSLPPLVAGFGAIVQAVRRDARTMFMLAGTAIAVDFALAAVLWGLAA